MNVYNILVASRRIAETSVDWPIAEDNRGVFGFSIRVTQGSRRRRCHRCRRRCREKTMESRPNWRRDEEIDPAKVECHRDACHLSHAQKSAWPATTRYHDRVGKCAKVSHGCRFYSESGATTSGCADADCGRAGGTERSPNFVGPLRPPPVETNNAAKPRRLRKSATRARIICNVNIP